ncbi:hypothetical protein CDD83_6914 [Cordyceps sp. RAO-2017]|nr:hypothetical protein CDD83_6914 [Cordyceps sp. RAO-2017]
MPSLSAATLLLLVLAGLGLYHVVLRPPRLAEFSGRADVLRRSGDYRQIPGPVLAAFMGEKGVRQRYAIANVGQFLF